MKMPVQIKLLLELNALESNGNGFDSTPAYRKLEQKLDPSLMKLYKKLRERKGTGTSVLKNCACSECMIIYPETHEMLRHGNSVHFCEYCGRLLVITEKSA